MFFFVTRQPLADHALEAAHHVLQLGVLGAGQGAHALGLGGVRAAYRQYMQQAAAQFGNLTIELLDPQAVRLSELPAATEPLSTARGRLYAERALLNLLNNNHNGAEPETIASPVA